ncbi:MAG TPA: HAD-IB family phosphatase [Anaerolineales bacterium]|nr:HAD-IB family phosphatase [Anaerolineales bacterium]
MYSRAVWGFTDLVIFDCDSTLSSIEGIDELAHMTGSQNAISALTKRAMEGDIPLESVYGKRLEVAQPTLSQVQAITELYQQNVIPDAQAVVQALTAAGCKVFIVSGGLIEPVRAFGEWLGIPSDHIYAVDMKYDQLSGDWWRYWEQHGGKNPSANYLGVGESPLAGTGGKNRVIDYIRTQHSGRAMLVGDGASDLEAAGHVDWFVGFGGVVKRQKVQAESPVFLHSLALSPLLPLVIGKHFLPESAKAIYADGLARIQLGELTMKDPTQMANFLQAVLD